MRKINLTILVFFYVLFLNVSLAFNLKETRYQFYNFDENKLLHAEILRSYFIDEAPDSIFNIGNHLILEGINSENSAWLNFGKLLISSYYTKKGKTEYSKIYLQECIHYYERKKDYLKLSDALNLYGLMYYYIGNSKLAIQSFQKSLDFAAKLPDEEEAFTSLVSLSS